jgi:hypothetical protein
VTKEPKLPLNDNFAGKAEGRLRQLDRRPPDAGMHKGRRRRPVRWCTTMRIANHRIFIFSAISIVGLVLGAILIAAVSRPTKTSDAGG